MTTSSLTIYLDTTDSKNPGYAYSFVVTNHDADTRHEETGEVEGDDLNDAMETMLDNNATQDGQTWREVLDGCEWDDSPDGARIWHW